MLNEVKEIGDFAINRDGLSPLDIIVDQPFSDTAIKEGDAKVICINFEKNNAEIDYLGVHVEDYNLTKLTKYLYRDHPSHRFRITPTDKISTLEKTSWRVAYWFRKYDQYLENDFINNIEEALIEDEEIKEDILSDIKESFESLSADSKSNSLLTLTFQTSDGKKYLGGFDVFNEILKEEGMNEFWNPDVPLKEGICYLCGNAKKVSRPREPFSFYTVNNRGFAQDLDIEKSWKQLSICPECTLTLEAGRNFLDKYLSKRFFGNRFYVIPKFNLRDIKEEVMEDIVHLDDKKYKDSLLSEEEDILYYMKDVDDVVNLIFVFYEVKQGGKNFDILKYVEDVPPSWIKKLFDVFEDVNSKTIFQEDILENIFGDEWEGSLINSSYKGEKNYYLSLGGFIRTFFTDYENTGTHDKEFLDIVGDILSKQKIQKNTLIKAFNREIKDSHVNEKWDERLLALKSLYIYTVLKRLNLITGENDMEKESKVEKKSDEYRSKVNEFFDEFSNALNTNAKKAVFLEGVLTRFLLDIQSQERGSTPFRSKLRGLRLDEMKVKNLFPDITEKLRQYDAPYYQWLEEMISQYFIAADNEGWDISKNEVSYYFALGLNLGRSFKIKEEEEKEGEKNE